MPLVAEPRSRALQGFFAKGHFPKVYPSQLPGVAFWGGFQSDVESPDWWQQSLERMAKDGIKTIYGPVDRNIWYRYRIVVPDQTSRWPQHFSWEPLDAPALYQRFLDLGFTVREKYHSQIYRGDDLADGAALMEPAYQTALENGFTFRPIEWQEPEELKRIYQMVHASFCNNFLYEPLSFENFVSLYSQQKLVGHRQILGYFILDRNQVERGFVYAFVDGDYVVFKTIAVLPELFAQARHRRHAPSSALAHLCLRDGHALGCRGYISALMKTDASSRYLNRGHSRWATPITRRYVLFGKDL